MILPIFKRDFSDARTVDGKLFIVDESLRKYMPKNKNLWATKIVSHVDAKHL